MSLGEASAKYWIEHAQFLKSAEGAIQLHIKRLLEYFGKNTYLHDIGMDKLRQFRAWRKNQCTKGTKNKSKKRLISTTSVNREIEIYRSIHNMADKDWKVEVSEINFKKIMFPKEDRSVSFFTEEQINDIIVVSGEKHAKNMIRFAFLTGHRWSNISNCKWEDVDLKNRIIEFRVKSTKQNGKLVYFEIHDILFDFLLALGPKEKGYLFTQEVTKDGKKYTLPIKSIKRSFETACKRAGLRLPRGQNIHILRHSAITHMLSKGMPIVAVKETVGHENIETTMRYAHISKKTKRDWLNQVYQTQNGHIREVKKNDASL